MLYVQYINCTYIHIYTYFKYISAIQDGWIVELTSKAKRTEDSDQKEGVDMPRE